MNWLQSIFYGLISGVTEFLPLSSFAHQQIFMQLCGEHLRDPARDLFVHIALLFALRISYRPILVQMRMGNKISGRGTTRNSRVHYDQKLIHTATIPMVIGFFVISYICRATTSLLVISLFLLVNGLILFFPDRIITGNKDAGIMSTLESIIIGISGALSAIPGISRLGCTVSTATVCGADRQHALHWALLLGIPALVTLIVIDLICLFTAVGTSQWQYLFYYTLSALSAFVAGYGAIKFIRFLLVNRNNTMFAYFSWGASLVAFFLYLTAV